jgi:hypothetical protein
MGVLALFGMRAYIVGMDEHITLHLRWRQTWPQREDDFSAFSPSHPEAVARIFRTGARATAMVLVHGRGRIRHLPGGQRGRA